MLFVLSMCALYAAWVIYPCSRRDGFSIAGRTIVSFELDKDGTGPKWFSDPQITTTLESMLDDYDAIDHPHSDGSDCQFWSKDYEITIEFQDGSNAGGLIRFRQCPAGVLFRPSPNICRLDPVMRYMELESQMPSKYRSFLMKAITGHPGFDVDYIEPD